MYVNLIKVKSNSVRFVIYCSPAEVQTCILIIEASWLGIAKEIHMFYIFLLCRNFSFHSYAKLMPRRWILINFRMLLKMVRKAELCSRFSPVDAINIFHKVQHDNLCHLKLSSTVWSKKCHCLNGNLYTFLWKDKLKVSHIPAA